LVKFVQNHLETQIFHTMNDLSIVKAQPDELAEAASLASHAMINLPENVAVFHGNRQRLESVFKVMFHRMSGQVLLAKDGKKIVGMMRLVQWPQCKPSPLVKLKIFPSMLFALKDTMPRGMKLHGMWAQHDPKENHWHLDPLAVRQGSQGQGIGSALMKYFCEYVDEQRENGYLETGTTRNVHFYERFGFHIIDKASILGATTWFMWRTKDQQSI